MAKNYYQLLGVKKDASPQEIKQKYRELALQLHPDRTKGNSPDERSKKTEQFKNIQEAYETLIDDEKRKLYDANPDTYVNIAGAPENDSIQLNLNELLDAVKKSDYQFVKKFFRRRENILMFLFPSVDEIAMINKAIEAAKDMENRRDVDAVSMYKSFMVTYELMQGGRGAFDNGEQGQPYQSDLDSLIEAVKISDCQFVRDFLLYKYSSSYIDISTINRAIILAQQQEKKHDIKDANMYKSFMVTWMLRNYRYNNYRYNIFTSNYCCIEDSLEGKYFKISKTNTTSAFMRFAQKARNRGTSILSYSLNMINLYLVSLASYPPLDYDTRRNMATSSIFRATVTVSQVFFARFRKIIGMTFLAAITSPILGIELLRGLILLSTGSLLWGIGALAANLFYNQGSTSHAQVSSIASKNFIHEESLQALIKLSPGLPKILVRHFQQRAEVFERTLNMAIESKREFNQGIVDDMRSNIALLEQDWNSIIENIDNTEGFYKAVQSHLDRKIKSYGCDYDFNYVFKKKNNFFGFGVFATTVKSKELDEEQQLIKMISNIKQPRS